MEDPKSSNKWKVFLIFMVILLIAIILIYISLQNDPAPKSTPAKPTGTSQQAAQDKSGSQNSPKPDNKQSTPSPAPSPPPSAPNGSNPQQMADAGPGDTILLFLVAATVGYVAHRSYVKRTLNL